ncbi:MAG: tetratricopeptide repeat protein [Alphaproteobacteria bacterium]|nr:tetratricopeptide repeat protein [Alphaproteobacteria bacterium]
MPGFRLVLVLILSILIGIPEGRAADPKLDPLFDRLLKTSDAAEARRVEAEIWQGWLLGGGAAATSLMELGVGAMSAGNLPAALGIFDAIVKQNPDYAEGWNKRATVLFMMGALDKSAEDVDKVLKLEPRHFGALAGLGLIRAQQDRVDEAIVAFEKALAVHPHLDQVKRNIEALKKKRRDGAI